MSERDMSRQILTVSGATTVLVRPRADRPSWQIVGGASDESGAVGRSVVQPDTVDSSSYIWAASTGAVADMTFGATPQNIDESGEGSLWFYANTGADTT